MTLPTASSSSDERVAPGLDVSIVAALAEIAARQDLSELEVEYGGMRIRIARERHAVLDAHATASTPLPIAAQPVAAEPLGLVKSPMVGIAYLRPGPDAQPFVEVGATVKAGDTLLLIEALQAFSEITAPRAGKVMAVFVEDGSPVEFGQPLLIVE